MMNKVVAFFKGNMTPVLLGLIAVLLIFMATQSTGTVSIETAEEAEVYTTVIDKLFNWILLLGLAGVVCYMAVSGKGGELDQNISLEIDKLRESPQFDKMERDFENAPDHIKMVFEASNSLLKMAETMLNLESVGSLTDIVEDLLDGPEETKDEAPTK